MIVSLRETSVFSPSSTAAGTLLTTESVCELDASRPHELVKPPTFKNVVIGSSALRICSWKKYARSPLQFSAGHWAVGEKEEAYVSLNHVTHEN